MSDQDARPDKNDDANGEPLCPISGLPLLASSDSKSKVTSTALLDVAVITDSPTASPSTGGRGGHACHLAPLVSLLHGEEYSRNNGDVMVLIQQKLPLRDSEISIVGVYDGVTAIVMGIWQCPPPHPAAAIPQNSNNNNDHTSSTSLARRHDFVAFKYAKQTFRLAVPKERRDKGGLAMLWSWVGWNAENNHATAQARVAHVLGMELRSGLRILHKGKLLFPDASKSQQAISSTLIDLSAESIQENKKPVLVVMGTRRGQEVAMPPDPSQPMTRWGNTNVGLLHLPLFLWNCGWHMCWTVANGMVLFLRSFLWGPLPDTVRNPP